MCEKEGYRVRGNARNCQRGFVKKGKKEDERLFLGWKKGGCQGKEPGGTKRGEERTEQVPIC